MWSSSQAQSSSVGSPLLRKSSLSFSLQAQCSSVGSPLLRKSSSSFSLQAQSSSVGSPPPAPVDETRTYHSSDEGGRDEGCRSRADSRASEEQPFPGGFPGRNGNDGAEDSDFVMLGLDDDDNDFLLTPKGPNIGSAIRTSECARESERVERSMSETTMSASRDCFEKLPTNDSYANRTTTKQIIIIT